MSSPPPSRPNVVLRVVAWYLALGAAIWLTGRWLPRPAPGAAILTSPLGPVGEVARGAGPGGTTLAPVVALVMVSAGMLSLPVAWVYVLTRAKRGYQQSVVQTMVILPIAVAGVVTLVKDSLPLAFSLAGIVAAVRFRTALDDSKDAVSVFVATSIGLASAMDLPVAVAISLVYNTAILALWFTDFGRTPAHLEGAVAEKRMRRAMERMTRTGSFVARVDDEILREMTAEQLQAVADRAARRARQHDTEADDEPKEMRMRVRTYDAARARQAVEPLLGAMTKRWQPGTSSHESDGAELVEYVVVLRRSRTPEDVAAQVRAAAAPHVIGVELV